jgi:hypothetical protein
MFERRNIFFHGLGITLRRLPAVLWTYAFSLGLAFIVSFRLHNIYADVTSHSLAAQRLTNGFDLGMVGETIRRANEGPSDGGAGNHLNVPLFLILYFLLVPGTLFCYQTKAPARLSTLFHHGLLFFWRFVRITLLTLLVSALILGPLFFIQKKWADHVDDNIVGRSGFYQVLTGYIIIFLVASIVRLYFDMVEVYTVQRGLLIRPNGKPDRRVRLTLGPAWRALRSHFLSLWLTFLALSVIGAAAVYFTARISMHMLAQPRVWPTFILAQLGLFIMLFTRFWQRGAETSYSLQHPIANPNPLPILPIAGIVSPIDPLHPRHPNWHENVAPVAAGALYGTDPLSPIYPPPTFTEAEQVVTHPVIDPVTSQPVVVVPVTDPIVAQPIVTTPIVEPISNPEPAPPSLDEPDPGVFHHDPTKPPTQ